MKKFFVIAVCLLFIAGCGTTTKEIDLSTDVAEDADFSSADYFKITDTMMNSLGSFGFFQMYAAKHPGEKPVMLLAKNLLNKTDEHIDTRLILEKIRTRMFKEGMADFVDDQAFDMALEQLDLQASDLYDNSKAAKLGHFVGAHYILRGTILNLRKKEGRKNINYMNITLDIFEVETLLIKWTDEVDIKRVTKKGFFR